VTVRRSRRLGQGLVAFGVSGLILLGLAGLLIVSTVGSLAETASALGKAQTGLVGMVEPAAASLRSSAAAARNAGSSLASSEAAARDAAALTTDLANSLDQLASLSSISFLGTQPFAQASGSFAATAARSRTLSASLTTTADALTTDAADALTVATSLEALAGQLGDLEVQLRAAPPPPPTAALIALDAIALLLLAWLAVPAVVAVVIGRNWSREG
jgi:hypothetical protein